VLSVRDVLGPGGFAEAVLPRFEVREAQLDMAEAVFDRLAEGGVLAVEAPTGVGKTLAYLVPAILSKRKRVVVSTNTKTLQDQIIDKDLPLLVRALKAAGIALVRASAEDPLLLFPPEDQVRYALMKGRSNYLCLERLDRRTRQRAFDLGLEAETPDVLLDDIVAWSKKTKTGDRAELSRLSEGSKLWAELDARSEICVGQRCPRYDECFVVKMRQEAQNAQLVIVNHHLLLADLALKAEAKMSRDNRSFGEVIPSAEALILDEAHALEEIASDYFGGKVSSRKVEALARDVAAFAAEKKTSLALDLQLTRAITEAESVFAELPPVEGRIRVRTQGGLEPGQDHALEKARAAEKRASAALSVLATSIGEEGKGDLAADILAKRTLELKDAMSFVLGAADPDYVYWSERQQRSVSLGASPINVARILARHFYPAFGATVMTSATLAAGDSGCRYFLESVGAPGDTYEMVLGSPFDYPTQAALYLPRDAPDPDHHDAVRSMARIAKEAIDLVGAVRSSCSRATASCAWCTRSSACGSTFPS
jgi:ATP-dependent DNA helicase DinG